MARMESMEAEKRERTRAAGLAALTIPKRKGSCKPLIPSANFGNYSNHSLGKGGTWAARDERPDDRSASSMN